MRVGGRGRVGGRVHGVGGRRRVRHRKNFLKIFQKGIDKCCIVLYNVSIASGNTACKIMKLYKGVDTNE